MNTLSPAQKKALAAIAENKDRHIAWQTAISLRSLGLIRGRYECRPAVLTDPTQWVVTDAGTEALNGGSKP